MPNLIIVLEPVTGRWWNGSLYDTSSHEYGSMGKRVLAGATAPSPEEATANVLRAYHQRWGLGTQLPLPLADKKGDNDA